MRSVLPFPPSVSLGYPRSCISHVLLYLNAKLSRPPEPSTCVSSEFQERRPGCQRNRPVTSAWLPHTFCVPASCLEDLSYPRESGWAVLWKMGDFLVSSQLYHHTHSDTAGHTDTHCTFSKPAHKCGLLSGSES